MGSPSPVPVPCICSTATLAYRRKWKLKANFASGSSYSRFKRCKSGAFNTGLITVQAAAGLGFRV